MGIPATDIYRKEWQAPSGTRYNYRLDIVPYFASLSSAVIPLSGAEANAIEIGAIESSFDKLPYGLQSPAQMTLQLVLSNLPDPLKTSLTLKQGLVVGGIVKNTFMLFSDRGTNKGTWTLEFVGTPAKINSQKYKKEAGAYVTTVELVDALYDAMVSMPMSDIESNTWAGNYHTVLYDVGFPSVARSDAFHTARVEDTGWSTGYFVESFVDVMTKIRTNITAELVRQTCRTLNTSDAALKEAADSGTNMPDFIGTCAEFYTCADAFPRTTGTALTKSTAKLVTRVIEKDTGNAVGGMVSSRDEVSWARYETAWDWYKDLCETFAAKVTYKPVYYAGGGSPYIGYTFTVKPIKQQKGVSKLAMSMDKALEHPEITETEDAVAKAEVRTQMFSDGNVSEWIVNAGVNRADQQFTLQNYLHNLPVTLDTIVQYSGGGDPTRSDFKSIGLFQTNRIVYESGGQCFTAHPTVKLYTTAASGTTYAAIDPDSSQDLGTLPPNPVYSGVALQEYNLWVNAVQSYGGLPFAIGRYVTSVLGKDNIATFEADLRIADYPTILMGTDALGDVADLSTSAVASDIDHLGWSNAVITGVTCDTQAGTATVRFTLVP
ncbi:hypothetical protein UFOVP418_12 [uncultured Caudovirales phage]|uniref:Uncharacterized protein n=1 Tax=uncultured Caudovirales phage TaxID=2100421 RepID=A0A6J5M392_9CAUD|nr:hypothetical protein UFOVP418_12 [uncultured Caudovirales phage]